VIGIRFHVDAQVELNEAALFYASLLPDLGKAFAIEAKKTVQLIQTYPDLGTPIGNKLRKLVVQRFPFSIIYAHQANDILILAIAHHRRRPGYWKSRQS
jgi:plasmid stabilization system protein ParE